MLSKIFKQLKKTRTYKIWISQFLIAMTLAFVVNKLSNIKLFSKESIVWWFLIGIIAFVELIIIAYGVTKKEEDLRKKSRMAYLHFDSQERLNQQIEIEQQFYQNDDYFKLLLSHLRTGTELTKFSKIAKSHSEYWVLFSLSVWDYFISIFRALINELIEKDEYLTLSIVEFWEKDKDSETIGKDHGVRDRNLIKNFFKSNFDKCSQGNVMSKRIIIVNVDRLNRGKIEKIHDDEKYYKAFRKILNKYSDEDYEHKNFYNRFYLVNDSEYEEIVKEDIPFALIRREDYSDKLCVSTYIPHLHESVDNFKSKDAWRSGTIPKIGFHIASDEYDEIWLRLYTKFNSIYTESSDSGKYFTPKQLKSDLDLILN